MLVIYLLEVHKVHSLILSHIILNLVLKDQINNWTLEPKIIRYGPENTIWLNHKYDHAWWKPQKSMIDDYNGL